MKKFFTGMCLDVFWSRHLGNLTENPFGMNFSKNGLGIFRKWHAWSNLLIQIRVRCVSIVGRSSPKTSHSAVQPKGLFVAGCGLKTDSRVAALVNP